MNVQEKLAQLDSRIAVINASRPLLPSVAQNLYEDFAIHYVHGTTAIEGNSYTLIETKLVLEDGITAGGKPLRDLFEILDAKNAVDAFTGMVQSPDPLSLDDIQAMHRLLTHSTLGDEAGCFRRQSVFIRGSMHVPSNWLSVPRDMDRFVESLATGPGKDEHLVEFQARMHHGLVAIHPFVDGNGRTARLMATVLALKQQYVTPVFTATNRPQYMKAMRAGDTGDFDPLTDITAEALEFMVGKYLNAIEQGDIQTEDDSIR